MNERVGPTLAGSYEYSDDPHAYREQRTLYEARTRFAQSLALALVRSTGAGYSRQRLPTRETYEEHQAWVRTFAAWLSAFRQRTGKAYPPNTMLLRWMAPHCVTLAELDAELAQAEVRHAAA